MVSLNSIEEVELWISAVKARGFKPWTGTLPDRLVARFRDFEIVKSYDRDAEYWVEAWHGSAYAKATVAPWVVDELAAREMEVENANP